MCPAWRATQSAPKTREIYCDDMAARVQKFPLSMGPNTPLPIDPKFVLDTRPQGWAGNQHALMASPVSAVSDSSGFLTVTQISPIVTGRNLHATKHTPATILQNTKPKRLAGVTPTTKASTKSVLKTKWTMKKCTYTHKKRQQEEILQRSTHPVVHDRINIANDRFTRDQKDSSDSKTIRRRMPP